MADVIERMTDKFMTVLHEKRPDMGELESRRDAVKRPHEAMLAAVRELQSITQEPDHSPGSSIDVWTVQEWLGWLCDEHELRSEEKRGDS